MAGNGWDSLGQGRQVKRVKNAQSISKLSKYVDDVSSCQLHELWTLASESF